MVNLSTIGVQFAYGVETAAGTKPTKFTAIPNCTAIGGISLEEDTIDVTPLEVDTRQYVAGLKDTGGKWTVTFNHTDDLDTKWAALKTASAAAAKTGLATWAEIYIPKLAKSCFVTFTPGDIPLNDISVGEALQAEISNVINEFKGWDTAVVPDAGE